MIDNIDIIKTLLNFSEEGDFYQLYVFTRKKDFPEAQKSEHQSVRTIKTYCISSIDYLEKRYDEIKALCEFFKARAYIHVQKQNHRDVGLNMISEIVTRIQSGNMNQKAVFDSTVGKLKTTEKRWIVDLDTKDLAVIDRIVKLINAVKPTEKSDKIIATVPTKSGVHLITERFDVQEFTKYMSLQGDVPDIQKKNPTVLYVPNSIM